MTREQAIEVLKNRYYSGVTRSRGDDEWRLATDTVIVALREKQQREKGCRYCEWIDITRAHEDEDGPLNYCRACGRKLAQSG